MIIPKIAHMIMLNISAWCFQRLSNGKSNSILRYRDARGGGGGSAFFQLQIVC